MKTAVILAGGKGTRLRPYTIALPKPLVPIGDKPILEIIITQLKNQGFEHIILAVNHQADIIRAYFEDGDRWGIEISYSIETKPLGTMGPLKLVSSRIVPEDFLVMNGDVLSDMDYGLFLEDHIADARLFTISSFRRTQMIDYGVLDVQNSVLCGFQEKPKLPYCVSMGVYALSKRVLEYIPDNEYYGFDQLMSNFLQKNKKIDVKEYTGYWMDIGRPEDYEQAIKDYENGMIIS